MALNGSSSSSSSAVEDRPHSGSGEKEDSARGSTPIQASEKHSSSAVVAQTPCSKTNKEANAGSDDIEEAINDTDVDTEEVPTCPQAPFEPPSVLDRVLSRTSTRCHPGPPPDGGYRAWIVCLSVHLIMMDTWGLIISFGTFQTYYVSTLGRPPSDISWIGSLQILLLFFVGTITGRLTDAGYFRALLVVGTVLQMVGIFTTAQGTEYWHLILAQGLVMGLGNGCLFCPSLAVLSTYFSKRRALALGLATCGSATGGLVFPAVARQLLPRAGFAWAMRVIGFIQLATLLVANVGLRPRLPPRRNGRIVEWAAFRDLEYTYYAVSAFFCYWALYVVFFYLASFSRDIIGMSYTKSLNLLLVLNGASVIGRVLPNYAADRLGAINLYIISAFLTGLGAFCWIAVENTAGLYVWSVYYGIAAGGIQSLFPAGLTSLTTDLSKAGVRMGMVFTIISLACFTGPPIAGAAITAGGGSYLGAQLFMGCALMAGVAFLVASRVVLVRKLDQGWKARV